MEKPPRFPADAAGLSAAFLDKAFTKEGAPKADIVDEEKKVVETTKSLDMMLHEVDSLQAESESVATSESEGEINKAELKRTAEKTYQEELDGEEDTEAWPEFWPTHAQVERRRSYICRRCRLASRSQMICQSLQHRNAGRKGSSST